jgi:hypothetical protein
MIPVTDDFFSEIEPRAVRCGDEEGMFEYLSARITELLQSASRRGIIGYIGAEFFGGEGNQCAVLYEAGQPVLGPLIGSDALNRALAALGVGRAANRDEFETIGLGKHRFTDRWISQSDL